MGCESSESGFKLPRMKVDVVEEDAMRHFHRVPPDVGLAASAAWKASPSTTLCPSTSAWAAPSQSIVKRATGVGRGRRERVGREGLCLEGRVLELRWGGLGVLSKGSWGRTHILGLSIPVHEDCGPKLLIKSEKIEGQQLKGKIVSEFFTLFQTFSHFFRIFPPGLSPSKYRVLAQGEQKRRKYNKKSRTNRCCTFVLLL